MIRPLTREDQLQNLADMDLETLRPEFQDQVASLRKRVINRIKAKTINGRQLNGLMLFNLAKSYVDAINKGAVPSIENSWTYICRNECLKATQEAERLFNTLFTEEFNETSPLNEEELKQLYKKCKT